MEGGVDGDAEEVADPTDVSAEQLTEAALAALSKDAENFGELSALYIRKSQAEENRKDV